MFKYAIKSMLSRKTVTALFTLALVVALTISMLAVNISSQVNDGFYRADSKYDVVIGPKGSDTQLVMSSLFFSELPVGKISNDYVTKIKEEYPDVKMVIPFGISDNYRGARVIGSTPELLADRSFKEGSNFNKPFDVVIGYNVAKAYNIQLGQQIITSHGLVGAGGEEHTQYPYTVVGILANSASAYDNELFTGIESIWKAHENEGEDEKVDANGNKIDDGDLDNHAVTAVLIRSGNLAKSGQIISEYNKGETQAVNPTGVMRRLMQNIDVSKQVALILCEIILILSVIIIGIMTVQMLSSINTEVKTLRFLGIKQTNIVKYIIYQNIILAILGAIVAVTLSRLALMLANNVSSKLGIILDINKIYGAEFVTMGVALAVCIIPVLVYIPYMFRRGLSNEE